MSAIVARLSRRLDEAEPFIRDLEARYAGTTPLTFLSPQAREALGDRLRALSINFSRLAVDSLAERLRVSGFLIDGAHDEDLWQHFRQLGMEEGSAQAHVEALAVGRSYVTVWGDANGPTATAEAASQVITERDPVSRETTAALKRWSQDGSGYAVLYLPDRVTTYRSTANVPDGGIIPPDGWAAIDSRPNPLGAVPVVQLTNRGRVSEPQGISEAAQIADLCDALTKMMVDALVTSEYFARPRRWATGLEIEEDEAGVPIDPFRGSDRTWQSEDVETRFGQFPTASMDGYTGWWRRLPSRSARSPGCRRTTSGSTAISRRRLTRSGQRRLDSWRGRSSA